MCSIVKGEMFFGAARSRDPATSIAEQRDFFLHLYSFPFDDAAAEIYGHVRAELTNRGQLIGSNDMMIAAICLANDLTLVTHNIAEFARVPGIKLEDWESP